MSPKVSADDCDYLSCLLKDDAAQLEQAAKLEQNDALRSEMMKLCIRSRRLAWVFRKTADISQAAAPVDAMGDAYRKAVGE